MCAQSHALGTRSKFQLEILIRIAISAMHKFRENILKSLRKLMKQPPGLQMTHSCTRRWYLVVWVAEMSFNGKRILRTHQSIIYDAVMTWKYFPNYWPFVLQGNPPVTGGFSPKRTSDAEIWFLFKCCCPEQAVKCKRIEFHVIWDAKRHMSRNCYVIKHIQEECMSWRRIP